MTDGADYSEEWIFIEGFSFSWVVTSVWYNRSIFKEMHNNINLTTKWISLQINHLFLLNILKIFIFSWSIIVLWYCVGFCHISPWMHHKHTCASSHLKLPPTVHPSHPSRLSQSTGFEFPASYSKFTLTLYFTWIMYMFQCYSQFVPPSSSLYRSTLPSPLCPQDCSLCLCLHCCCCC